VFFRRHTLAEYDAVAAPDVHEAPLQGLVLAIG